MNQYNRLKVRKYYEDKKEFVCVDIGSLDDVSIFTGYKDKNEKEIYSGDRFIMEKGDIKHTGRVKYSNVRGFYIVWDLMAYRNDIDFWFVDYKESITVVGNEWEKD